MPHLLRDSVRLSVKGLSLVDNSQGELCLDFHGVVF
jgi:hypothetical protein